MDGSGNYFILSHKRVAQIHPLSVPKLGLPEWVLFHEHSFSEDNAGGVNWVEIGSTFGPCGLVNPVDHPSCLHIQRSSELIGPTHSRSLLVQM